MVVPIKLATTTLRIEVGIPAPSPPILSISASSNYRIPPSRSNYTGLPLTALRPADLRSTLLSRPQLAGGYAHRSSGCVLRVEPVGNEHVSGAVRDHQGWPGAHGHRLRRDPARPEDGH